MSSVQTQPNTPIVSLPFHMDPLGFIDKMTLRLCKADSHQDLVNICEEFLDEESLRLFQNNAEMCLPLSYVWSGAVRRIVFNPKDILFPNLLLLFPPLYQELGWTHENNEEWDAVHEETLQRFDSGHSRHDAIMLLFLEAMKFGLYEGMLLFQSRIPLMPQRQDRQLARALQSELYNYGWPVIENRYLA